MPLSADTIAVGVGALGRDYEDCQDCFGEFLAAAGVAAYLPTDGSNAPDYLLIGEATAANVRLCYGLSCTGRFAHLNRFETRKGSPVTLTSLVTSHLDLLGAEAIGLVLIAECASLMGAALRRSPIGSPTAETPFAYPEIREWLTFTAERAYRKLLLLDEHTAALDPKSADQVIALSEQIITRDKLTTLMVTHSMQQAAYLGDRLLMMHRGRVIHDDTGVHKRHPRPDDSLARFEVVRRGELVDESAAAMIGDLYV